MHEIGIISDTHGTLPDTIFSQLSDVECILHAGDLGNDDILQTLVAFKPVHAVCGNMDTWAPKRLLPDQKIIEIGPLRFLLIHGHRFPRPKITQGILSMPEVRDCDAAIFGHTHQYYVARHGQTWLVNPGAIQSYGAGDPATGILMRFSSKSDLQFEKLILS